MEHRVEPRNLEVYRQIKEVFPDFDWKANGHGVRFVNQPTSGGNAVSLKRLLLYCAARSTGLPRPAFHIDTQEELLAIKQQQAAARKQRNERHRAKRERKRADRRAYRREARHTFVPPLEGFSLEGAR